MRKMILVTHLDVWMLTGRIKKPGTGNQSLYNTLLGYARADWQVHMLTTSRTCAGMPSIHDNVIIHRQPIRWYEFYSWAKKKAGELLGRGKGQKAMASAGEAPRAIKPPPGLYRYSRLFRRVMGRRAVNLARRLGGVEFIYGHEIHGALAGEKAAKTLRVPLITRFQGTELCRFLSQPDEMLRWKSHLEASRVDADLVIMTDDGTQGDEVLDSLGVPRERVRFWMNGVVKDDVYRPNMDRASLRAKLGLADGEAMVLHTNRMFHWKRIDRHLRVLRRARDMFDGFKTIFIGDGAELVAMKQLCHDLDLDGCVRFLGALPHDEVMNYLNACDVYISFCDLTNLSNSLIESCVCGKCIVTTNVGGTGHLLTDRVNGVVVASSVDEAAIAAGVVRVLKDPAERARLAQGAFRRGQELETWDQRMKREVAEVEQVLERRRISPA